MELPHWLSMRTFFLVRTGWIYQRFEVLGSVLDFQMTQVHLNLTYKHPASGARHCVLSFGHNPRPDVLNFEMRMVLQLYAFVYQDT